VLLTSNWRSPASCSSRVREAQRWRPSSLPQRSQAPPRRSPAPSRRVWPPPLTARRRTHLRPSRALAPLPPPRPVATGVGNSTSQGGTRPPSLSSPSCSHDDEFSGIAGGESPCCSHSRHSSLSCSRRSRRRIFFSFLHDACSCSRRCRSKLDVDLGVGALGISSNIHSTFLNITGGFCQATN
jgi:hypothetical protein